MFSPKIIGHMVMILSHFEAILCVYVHACVRVCACVL